MGWNTIGLMLLFVLAITVLIDVPTSRWMFVQRPKKRWFRKRVKTRQTTTTIPTVRSTYSAAWQSMLRRDKCTVTQQNSSKTSN